MKVLRTFPGIFLLTALIGCSNNKFTSADSSSQMSSPSSPGEIYPPLPPTTSPDVPTQVDSNPACAALKSNPVTGAANNYNGQDFFFNGISSSVDVANAGQVLFNGIADSLTIDGATDVLVNGITHALCILAKHVTTVNGIYGQTTNVPLVIMGQDDQSSIDGINGILNSNLVLMRMISTGVINGVSKDIYISGGRVSVINGIGGNLYLSDGAVVELLNGIFGSVTLSGGAVVLNDNSIHP